tara:strand:- start:568 stop:771 length:204 start_codon:yes stop_codon:yes gene_type:complete
MASVKIVTNTPGAAPKPQRYADIKGQGRIPYCQMEDVATPNTSKAKITTGKKRGMGAALRGSRFTNA